MPTTYIPAELRRLVIERANNCCEYCLIHQDDCSATLQVDHILALKHGGQTISENLALACQLCNRYKGSDFATIDRATGEVVFLFNPRTQIWSEHFQLSGAGIVGLTQIGRATVILLQMNDEARIEDRQDLIDAGRYPLNQIT
jgi:hypothetical protein